MRSLVPVPDYQTLMAPALGALADGAARTTAQLRDIVAQEIGLTEDERQVTIPSGAPLFDNRVHWAVTYMKQAGLVRRPRRGVVEITNRGKDVLVKYPDRVDNDVLA